MSGGACVTCIKNKRWCGKQQCRIPLKVEVYAGSCTAKVRGRRICSRPANTPGAAHDLCVKHYKDEQRGIPFDHVVTVINDSEQVVFRLASVDRKKVQKFAERASLSEAGAYRHAVANLIDKEKL